MQLHSQLMTTVIPHFALGLLEKTDLDMVAEELDSVSSKWYALGQKLLDADDDLDSIRAQSSHNHKVCMREMLSKRIQKFYCTTWSDTIAGLRTSVDSELAYNLKAKYCSSELASTLQGSIPVKCPLK